MQTAHSTKREAEHEEYNADQPLVSERAIRLAGRESFLKALMLLEELSVIEPVEYAPISDNGAFAIVMPSRYFQRAISFLEGRGIMVDEMKVASLSDLPVEAQAKLRGLTR